MKIRLVQFSLIAIAWLLLSSCAELRYSDQGKPLDFLHAKRYKAAKKELVQEQSDKNDEIEEQKVKEEESKSELVKKSIQSNLPLWAMVLIAIIISPLAVGLYEDATSRFWLNLVLFSIGYLGLGLISPLVWLIALCAIVHALLIVLDVI
jgi:uncharacterized membrane protein YqaE (UPF0057 family)